jgi:hypothetical protein
MGAKNRLGIGLSYRPASLQSLAELVPWNRFLGSLKVKKKFGLCYHIIIPGILSIQDGLEQGALKGGLLKQSGIASTHLHISPSQAVMFDDVTGYPDFLLQVSEIKFLNIDLMHPTYISSRPKTTNLGHMKKDGQLNLKSFRLMIGSLVKKILMSCAEITCCTLWPMIKILEVINEEIFLYAITDQAPADPEIISTNVLDP